MTLENAIIYLIGFPGTGKYTIAKEISKLDNFIIIDNHFINNPIFSLIKLDGKTKIPTRTWDNTKKILDAILDTMVNISPKEYNFIITNALFSDSDRDHKIYKKIEAAAKARKSLFIPVRLLVSKEDLQKRIISADRSLRLKETSAESAVYYSENKEVFRPKNKNLLELDISNLEPDKAAEKILSFCKKRS